MSDRPRDLEAFALEHRSCGGLTPSVTERVDGRHLLTLRCSCDAVFEQPVTQGSRVPPPAAQSPPAPSDTRGSRGTLQAALESTLLELGETDTAKPPVAAPSLADTARPAAKRPPAASSLPPAEPGRPRRPLTVRVAIIVAMVLILGAGGWFALQWRDSQRVASAAAPRSVSLPEGERAAVVQATTVLGELQSVSRADVSFRVYANRVSFAKPDFDRHMANVKDADIRPMLQDILALHVLAATAWRAKTLNEREGWEAVGADASVDLCPPLRRILAVGDEPQGVSSAHWRGIAIAASIPLLWDCAAERMNHVEKRLRGR